MYLLNAIDELVTSILGEIIFCKDFAAVLRLIAYLFFMLINDIENTVVSSSSILAFKFWKRVVIPDFLVSPSASALIVSLLYQLNLWKESGEEREHTP
jgi:predicted membrane protein